MTDKPLHIRVAEAVGEKPVDAAWGYSGPPSDGEWSHERSRLFPTFAEAVAAYEARGFDHSLSHEYLCFWKDGWGPIMVSEYDTDWSATGQLIEKYGIGVAPDIHGLLEPEQAWHAWGPGTDRALLMVQALSNKQCKAQGSSALIAVCNLILALSEAGKLAA